MLIFYLFAIRVAPTLSICRLLAPNCAPASSNSINFIYQIMHLLAPILAPHLPPPTSMPSLLKCTSLLLRITEMRFQSASWDCCHPMDFVYDLHVRMRAKFRFRMPPNFWTCKCELTFQFQMPPKFWISCFASCSLLPTAFLVKVCSMLNPKPSKNRFPCLL